MYCNLRDKFFCFISSSSFSNMFVFGFCFSSLVSNWLIYFNIKAWESCLQKMGMTSFQKRWYFALTFSGINIWWLHLKMAWFCPKATLSQWLICSMTYLVCGIYLICSIYDLPYTGDTLTHGETLPQMLKTSFKSLLSKVIIRNHCFQWISFEI